MLSGTRSRPPVWCQPAPSQSKTARAPGATWCADLFQMLTHSLGVDARHDDRRTDGAVRADGAEEVGRGMPIVANHQRPRAPRRPDIGVRSLLPDSGFVLEPDLYRRAGGAGEQRILQQTGEVFLKVSSAVLRRRLATGPTIQNRRK